MSKRTWSEDADDYRTTWKKPDVSDKLLHSIQQLHMQLSHEEEKEAGEEEREEREEEERRAEQTMSIDGAREGRRKENTIRKDPAVESSRGLNNSNNLLPPDRMSISPIRREKQSPEGRIPGGSLRNESSRFPLRIRSISPTLKRASRREHTMHLSTADVERLLQEVEEEERGRQRQAASTFWADQQIPRFLLRKTG